MTQMAWLFMMLAWVVIIGCTLYCFVKLLNAKPPSDGGSCQPVASSLH